jgi:hypothetical protein
MLMVVKVTGVRWLKWVLIVLIVAVGVMMIWAANTPGGSEETVGWEDAPVVDVVDVVEEENGEVTGVGESVAVVPGNAEDLPRTGAGEWGLVGVVVGVMGYLVALNVRMWGERRQKT